MPPIARPELSIRDAARMVGRALRLKCPHCGGGPVLASWFHLRDRCPRCKLHLHREEGDYFLGAYTVMLLAMETMFALGFLIVLLVTWPNPPWAAIQWGGAVVLLIGVLVSYPFAKTLWLAIDLMFRPVARQELGWDDQNAGKDDEVRRQ